MSFALGFLWNQLNYQEFPYRLVFSDNNYIRAPILLSGREDRVVEQRGVWVSTHGSVDTSRGSPRWILTILTSSRLLCNYIELFGGIQSFLWGHWSPCLELLVTSGLDFKVGWIPLLYHFWNIYRFPTVFWFLFPFFIFCILESFLFASLKCPNLNTKNSSKANFLFPFDRHGYRRTSRT